MDVILITRHPRLATLGIITAGSLTFDCAIGRSGFSTFKREGDGATPAPCVLRPLWGYWRTDRGAKPDTTIPMVPIHDDLGWCDEPQHGAYNNPVRLPFAPSHETLKRDDELYDICIVLNYNMIGHGRLRHRGSAIFMHVARPGYTPTQGCIALENRDLRRLLIHVTAQTKLLVSP